VDRGKVIRDCGLDDDVESYQTVEDGLVAAFLAEQQRGTELCLMPRPPQHVSQLVGVGYAMRLKHALGCSAWRQGTMIGDDQPVLSVPADL
jgi:hypothetical protein